MSQQQVELPVAEVEEHSGPTDKQIKRITELARVQLDLQKEIELIEKKLNELNDRLKKNREIELTAALDEAGVKAFTLSNGASIEVGEVVQASITEVNKPKAHGWLEKNKHEDMIKRQITILFGRDDVKWAQKFLKDCEKRKKKLNLKVKEFVDTNTLKAFVREQRREFAKAKKNPDEAVPKELFGVYVARFAHVITPKEEI